MTAAAVDPRRLCQLELVVTDLGRAAGFYSEVFGWSAVPAELHEMVVLEVPDDCPFGILLRLQVPGLSPGHGVIPYFATDDAAAIAQRATAAGGLAHGPTSLAGYGMVWHTEDHDGNRIGLYTGRR